MNFICLVGIFIYFIVKEPIMKIKLLQLSLFFLLPIYSLFSSPDSEGEMIQGSAGSGILAEDFGIFNEPWAMVFINQNELLITEKSGNLVIFSIREKKRIDVSGVPSVAYGGQGGLGDIILHPDFRDNRIIYLSYAEQDSFSKRGAAVAMARLQYDGQNASLEDLKVIWRQIPKETGKGHYAHRLAFDDQGYLFITSGERQKQKPAQDWSQNLGKIIRLRYDGSVPEDNPFQDKGELARTYWTLGHRNMLGIAFDQKGQLWVHEMGPRHGDELNVIEKGENYGWPIVSWGNHYSGEDIPDHDTRPEFREPAEYWIPSIAPSGLIIYQGDIFPGWQGNALIGGLVSKSLVRVKLLEKEADEVERFDMDKRIREVEEGPDGFIWILEDGRGATLRRLRPY
jgi:aldose sugar dehydrogenase